MNSSLEYGVEIDINYGDDEDNENKAHWNQLTILQNKEIYLCTNLDIDKRYRLRSRCKNEYGWSTYSNIVSFKTS